MKNWLEPTSIRDIKMFINIANFYWRFIQSFSRIVILFIFLLKTTRLLKLALKAFKVDNNEVVSNSGNITNETFVNSLNQLKNNKSKNLTYMLNIRAIKKLNFLTSNAKKIFNHL